MAERLHAGRPRETVLCAWGIIDDGQKVLLDLAPATKEETASCTAFFEDLKRRGLAEPRLVVTHGAPGLIRAVETCFASAAQALPRPPAAESAKQSPGEPLARDRAAGASCYEAASPAIATVLRADFVQTYKRELPAVVQCFTDDIDAYIAHLRFQLRHRRGVVRTTNLLERLFLEERRRTKIIPHAFVERPVLRLMYAAVIRAAERCRGIAVGEFDRRQLRAIRDELGRAHAERVATAVTAKATPPGRKLRAER